MSTRGAERREQMRSPDIVGDVCEVPVFRPTMEEMRMGFEAYIHKIENQIAIKGLVKIIPPSEWEPRKGGYSDIDDLVRVESPIRQHTTGGRGIFRNLFVTERTTPVSKFRMDVTKPSKRAPARLNGDLFELERYFWRNLTFSPPVYGADIRGSLMDKDLQDWNLQDTDTFLDRTLRANHVEIPGVGQPYLYFGSWRALFAWHTEDIDLYSINYLHFGAPKFWYTVSPADRDHFERTMQGLVPDLFRHCDQFMRHKVCP